ncbi:hypothetical protein [Cuspidothrix issatschenkoi]|nr:hypothetical protein [Cuspidothrix issatschenkoi]
MSIRIIKSSRMCFEPILTIIVACNTFMSALQYLYYIRHCERLSDTLRSVNIQPSLPLTIPAPGSGIVLKFDPSNLLLELSHNHQPSQIQFSEERITDQNTLIPEGSVEMPDLSLLRKRLIQSVFTDFYETQKSRADEKWNKLKEWDSIWKFAWLVRNALAHGGKINWRDQRISSVFWKTISYTYPNDHEREIIFQDIGEGDLIILIDELDKALI